MNVVRELASLELMTVDQLRQKYEEVFGEPARSRHKQYLVKRIIWRMQANAEGDLSERARRRALELANDADLRSTPPRPKKVQPGGDTVTIQTPVWGNDRFLPGSVICRDYKGRQIRVMVLDGGSFEFEGDRYKSLTAVAKAVTGKHWNGYHFFGLRGGTQK